MAKGFQIYTIQNTVERALQKCLAEPQVVNDVATPTNEAPTFTNPVVKVVKEEPEKRSVEKNKIEQNRNVSNKVLVFHRSKAKDEFPRNKIN